MRPDITDFFSARFDPDFNKVIHEWLEWRPLQNFLIIRILLAVQGLLSSFSHLFVNLLHVPSQTYKFGFTAWHVAHRILLLALQWRHNGRDGTANHQPRYCFLNRLFMCRSKKTSKLRITGLCAGNSPATGEFPAQRASNTENVSIWWRHHVFWIP